jgi:outer membrane receptor protein involved in Fe transport
MKSSLLSLFLIIAPLLSDLFAADPEKTLEPVVVTDSRLRDVPREMTQVPGKVIVITDEEIRSRGSKTVQEVLQYETGIVLYDQIGNEFQSTVDLRGFNGTPVPATSVFVDGVRVNEPDFNQTNFDLIPIEDIERIEILPGTATLFGRNALGGIINITTKRGRKDRPHFGIDIGGGSFGRQRYTFNTDGPLPLKDFDYYFGLTRELTNGFREDTPGRHAGARVTRIFTKIGYRRADTDISLSLTHVDDKVKQAGSLPESILRVNRNGNITPGDFYDGDSYLITMNLQQRLGAGFSMALNGFFRDNRTENFVKGLFESVFDGHFKYSQGGGTVQLTHESKPFERKNLMTIGVEYGRNLFSNKTSGSFFADKSTQENIFGLYFLNSYDLLESLNLSAGFRYDRDQIDFNDHLTEAFSFENSFSRVSPKAGLTYNPFKNLGFYFSYSEGFRTPIADEFAAFGPPPTFTPFVVSLNPVRSRNFELGIRGKLGSWLEADAAFFYMPVRDEIIFVLTEPSTFTGQNSNIDKSLRRGFELSVKARYQKLLDLFVNYTLTKATFESNVLLFSGQVQKGDEFPLVPRHRASTGINVRPLDGLTVSLLGTYVGSQYLLNDEPNEGKKLDDYFVLNTRLAYEWKSLTAYFSVNNLTHQKYTTFGILGDERFLVPAPGINVFGGISFRY